MKKIVVITTVAINILIVFLTLSSYKIVYNFSYLVHVNALNNFLSLLFLLIGLVFIFRKKIFLHKIFMNLSFISTAMFLIGYVLYHISTEPTRYQGDNKLMYYSLLISHILSSFILTPLSQLMVFSGWFKNIVLHKRISKTTYLLWIYCNVTGIFVYYLLKPFYNF